MRKPRFHTGVYCFLNIANGKRYIGSTSRLGFSRRWKKHLDALDTNSHCNSHLQSAWNKYGKKSFVFMVIEKCKPAECLKREDHYIQEFDSTNPEKGYNILKNAGSSLGYEHTQECRTKMSMLHKERLKDPQELKKMSIVAKKAYEDNPKLREVQSEIRRKLWENPEWRANQIAKRLGKPCSKSKETLEIQSEEVRSRWVNPEWRSKTIAAQKLAHAKKRLEGTNRMSEGTKEILRQAALRRHERERQQIANCLPITPLPTEYIDL